MRFQQLKRDPNNIMRKKLVKSKKNWVVVSSLALAGGLFLLGSPTEVKADVVNPTTPNAQVQADSQNGGNNTSGTMTEKPADSNIQPQAQNDSSIASNKDTGSNMVQNDEKQQPTSSVQTANDDDSNSNAKQTVAVPESANVSQQPTTSNNQANSTTQPANNYLDQGTSGTSAWYISNDKTLHIGAGNLDNPSTKNQSQWTDNDSDKISSISFDGNVVLPDNSDYLFAGLPNLETVQNYQNMYSAKTTDMQGMFSNDKSLKSLDLHGMNVGSAKDMSYLFANDPAITSINIFQWNSKNVRTMASMFQNDSSLVDLNTSQVQTDWTDDMSHMFDGLSSITSIDLDSFSTGQCEHMPYMFANDPKLTIIAMQDYHQGVDYGPWYFGNVLDSSYMFLNDKSLKSLNTQNWWVAFNRNMTGMFKNSGLDHLDISTWYMVDLYSEGDSSKGTGMFDGTNFKYIVLGPINKFNSSISLPSSTSATWTNEANESNPKNSLSFTANAPTSSSLGYLYGGIIVPDPTTSTPKTKDPQGYVKFVPANDLVTADVTINSNIGPQIVKDVKGTKGLTVDVNVPTVKGYIINDPKTITCDVTNDGKIVPRKDASYTKQTLPTGTEVTADVNIPSNLGTKTVKDITGKVGDTLTVKVPAVTGYTPDKKTVSATVNNDGTITTKDTVTYKANNKNNNSGNSHHNSGSNSSSNNTSNNDSNNQNNSENDFNIEYLDQTVATFSDQPDVVLYSRNTDNTMSVVKNRELKHGTDWFSDQKLTTNGISYYRVATNEWVKTTQVYPYIAMDNDVMTYSDSDKYLLKAEGTQVKNRALAPNTGWFTDRYTYINGVKYYRVATNEFVSADDAYTY